MKKSSISIGYLALIVSFLSLFLSSCIEKEPSLGAIPAPSFKTVALTPTSDLTAANVELINTTQSPSIAYWNIEGLGTFKGDTVQVAFIFAGDYPVQLTVVGQGGTGTITQTVNVPNDNPYAVGPTTILGILTGAALGDTQRTWMPNRVTAGVALYDSYADVLSAMDAGGGSAWYYFGQYGELATDGTGRDAYFDDKYTFGFGVVGTFDFNDNSTVYLDGGSSPWTKALQGSLNGSPYNAYSGNVASAPVYAANPANQPWASGKFTYNIAPAPAGAMKLGQIIVNGVGAHFGLQDKSNTNEQVTPTSTSLTYDVLRITTALTDAGGTYDLIIVGLMDNGNNYWGFQFKSYH